MPAATIQTSVPPQKTILVVRRRYVGDLILTKPVFANLRRHWPGAWITAVVDEGFRELAAWHSDVNEVLEIPRQKKSEWFWVYWMRWMRFLRTLRLRPFDLAFDLTQNTRSALVTLLSGAPRRVSYWIEQERGWHHRCYHDCVFWSWQDHADFHMVDLLLKPLEKEGIPIVTRDISVEVPAAMSERVRQKLSDLCADNQSTTVLIHPGARTRPKLWPVENFAAVADRIQSELGAQVLFTSGRSEMQVVWAIVSRMKMKPAVYPAPESFSELAVLLKEADVFLGHDSGPMHIAAAVGTPVVALFGAQDPHLWGPWGENHIALRASLPCQPCLAPQLCRPPAPANVYCVRQTRIDEVLDAIATQLARLETPTPVVLATKAARPRTTTKKRKRAG
ncbi:MAG: glycosyltransferase family 9 protein [Verrucomicrobiota bacterium]